MTTLIQYAIKLYNTTLIYKRYEGLLIILIFVKQI